MLELFSYLPRDRHHEGVLLLFRDGVGVLRARCRGEADNTNAAQHDNIIEDPTQVGGDHPFGSYWITEIVSISPLDAPTYARYGPYFFRLDPIDGEALLAKQNGRAGLGIHGGVLHRDGRLRETFGCLRVDNETAIMLANFLMPHGLPAQYVCTAQ